MSNKIIFFNHYHRGDLFTHKEFIRHLKSQLNNSIFLLQYLHFNHYKVNLDLDIPLIGNPSNLSDRDKFIVKGNTLYVNTWVGTWQDQSWYTGVNLFTLKHSWNNIFTKINDTFGTNLVLNNNIEYYLPSINFSYFNLKNVDKFIEKNTRKKVLLCNGTPMSGQSFPSDMSDVIIQLSDKYKYIDFICTKKFITKNNSSNMYFTDDIIDDNDLHLQYPVFWHDRGKQNCDLNEISHLSTFCDLIIGKSSGPFVFSETKENYFSDSKSFINFCNEEEDSLYFNLNPKCKYFFIKNHNENNVYDVIDNSLSLL